MWERRERCLPREPQQAACRAKRGTAGAPIKRHHGGSLGPNKEEEEERGVEAFLWEAIGVRVGE